ncbi:HNH endonuclease signature motif containing protein [Dysgonomonas reticulitermitis]
MKHLILLFLFLISLLSYSQTTYKRGDTEYYTDQYYKTGHPKVKRSQTNKKEFLKSKGLYKLPEGCEIDHIIPLSKGGTDSPSNMQLLTKAEHKQKTKAERRKDTPKRMVYTGSRGGKYYYNNKGKKVYLKKNENIKTT